MGQELQVLFLPFLACLILTGIHVYLGIHVIARKVIFVDIALAQIAALGATVAFLLGYDPRTDGSYYLSLLFAVLAAIVFSLTRTRRERVPQEAVIGLAYATASAAAILLADISPHGAEHLHDLLAGSIVWVTPGQIARTAVLYAIVGLFHYAFRRRFLLISLRPEEAYAQGVNVRLWDFLFYLSFGFVITSSVQIAGVLLVFCYLVAPAVFAVMFFDDLRRRLVTGWVMAALVSAVGLLFSYDRPSGPTIIVGFAVALGLGGAARAVASAPRRARMLLLAVSAASVLGGIGWLFHLLRPAPRAAPGSEPAVAAPAPAHPVGAGLEDLRRALRDTHDSVRAGAVAELSRSGDPRVTPDLLDALHDQSPAVREAAAAALLDVGGRAALPALRQALKNRDEDEWVRLRMAQAVAGLGDAAGIPVLLDLARRGSAGVMRLEALATLLQRSPLGEAAPADPDSDAASRLLRRLELWWESEKDRVRWDEGRRIFH